MNRTIFFMIMALLVFSSCSSQRYGYIPKVKAPKNQQVKAAKKIKMPAICSKGTGTLNITQTESPAIENPSVVINNDNKPAAKKLDVKIATLLLKKADKKITIAKTTELTKAKMQQNAAADYESFWDTDFGYFIMKVLIWIGIIAILLFIYWLDSIGLGWLLAILGIVALVVLILLISDALGSISDWIPHHR